MRASWAWIAVILAFVSGACDAEDDTFGSSSTATGSSSSSGGGSGGAAGGTAAGGSSSTGTGGGSGGGEPAVYDPAADGPYTYEVLDDVVQVAATGSSVPVHCAFPTAGPGAGPFPVILVAHGFQLPPSQYYSYVYRLATFGYVAVAVDFPAGMMAANHVRNAQDVLGALDWAAAKPELSGQADTALAGATGHSLGGKVSLLAATMDSRIKAAITLDPVDTATACDPALCPDVSAMMPIPIPTGFIGETLDSTGFPQACAPAADNFLTFYAGTSPPSLLVEVLGAAHMSFLDDPGSCGMPCLLCQQATVSNDEVTALSRAFVVAFYERHLKGNAGYDTYLTGAEAQARYVASGLATIDWK